jgi:hypothetical protein
MSCTCRATPHENWCSEAPKGLSLGEVVDKALNSGLGQGKSVMVDFGGNLLPVTSVSGSFVRGEFALVIGVQAP